MIAAVAVIALAQRRRPLSLRSQAASRSSSSPKLAIRLFPTHHHHQPPRPPHTMFKGGQVNPYDDIVGASFSQHTARAAQRLRHHTFDSKDDG